MFLTRVSYFVGQLPNWKNITHFPLTRGCIFQNGRAGYSSKPVHPKLKVKQTSKPKVFQMEDKSVNKTIHVYSDKNSSERFYRWLPYFGLLQGVIFSAIGIFSFTLKVTDEDIALLGEESQMMEWMSTRQKRYKKIIVVIYLFTAVACVTVCSLYPTRIIKNIWLLKGGKHIAVESFSRFRTYRYLTLPLSEVSGKITRKESSHTVPLKFKDRFAMYVMHLDKGVLHRPDLFDYLIALKREFPK